MNEKQANAQQKLSHGRPIGQDSINDSNNDLDKNTKQVSSTNVGEKTITKSTFIIMIGVGLFLDLVGLIFLLGWFTSSIILIFIYLKLGVKFHFKNVLKFGSCDLIKSIPGLSLIPAFTLSVILNLGPMIEGLEDSIPGGEVVAHSVQKALSATKK